MKNRTINRSKIELALELIEWMADRPAFLYPELLPISALKPSGKNSKDDKAYFAKSEDNLIALGKFYKLFYLNRLDKAWTSLYMDGELFSIFLISETSRDIKKVF